MKAIIKRPPGDTFTIRLFYDLTKDISVDYDCLYFWSIILEPQYLDITHLKYQDTYLYEFEIDFRNFILDNIKNKLVILGIKDHLTYGPYDYEKKSMTTSIENLKCLFNLHTDKHFILLTSLEKLDQCLSVDNVDIIPWGGDITNQEQEYKSLPPFMDKNFDSPYSYLNLNRGKRIQRALSVCMQFGLGLNHFGLISAMFQHDITEKEIETSKQLFKDSQVPLFNLCRSGFYEMKKTTLLINDDSNIYPTTGNDNVSNFKTKLKNYYRETFIELISETSYFENSFLLTEKTLNSIYGCCFPIFLSSQGVVEFLRDIGLDVFDDIIDHSYDKIADPIERMYSALYRNKELLSNVTTVKQLWNLNQHRFLANINFAKTDLYKFYTERAKKRFSSIVQTHKY